MSSSSKSLDTVPLSTRLREHSKSTHNNSDKLVNAKLVVAFTDRVLYGQALFMFYGVFAAIERELACHKNLPVLAPLANLLPAIKREEQFEKDLDFYLGPTWRNKRTQAPEVAAYIAHVQAISQGDEPYLLLAHFYTQHMGIGAGGQILRRSARRLLRLPSDQGTCAFEYPDTDATKVKQDLKAAVNQVEPLLSQEQQQKVLEEHTKVFLYNNKIIAAFKVGYQKTFVALLKVVPLPVWVALLALILVLVLTRGTAV